MTPRFANRIFILPLLLNAVFLLVCSPSHSRDKAKDRLILPTFYLGFGDGIGGERNDKEHEFQLDFTFGLRIARDDKAGLFGFGVTPEMGYTYIRMPVDGQNENAQFFRIGGMVTYSPGGGIRLAYQAGKFDGETIRCLRSGLVITFTSVAFAEISYQKMKGPTVPKGWDNVVSVSWNFDVKWAVIGFILLFVGVPWVPG